MHLRWLAQLRNIQLEKYQINEHLDNSHYAKKNQQNYCRKCTTARTYKKKIARKLDTPYITGLDTIQKNEDSNVSLGLRAWDIDWTSTNI